MRADITKIINTHEHFDHIDGNPGIVSATGATIHAHANAIDRIPNVDVGLAAGEIVAVGDTVRLRVLDTPGHTLAHVCLASEIGAPTLFCGDTLFNASVGNCHHGGDVRKMYWTFVEQLFELPDDTTIYPGHDYICNNLNFALSLEPSNIFARELLARVKGQNAVQRLTTTIAIEQKVNPFFRLATDQSSAASRRSLQIRKTILSPFFSASGASEMIGEDGDFERAGDGCFHIGNNTCPSRFNT